MPSTPPARQARHGADVQDHLADRAFGRQIRPGGLQHLFDARLGAACEIRGERLQQGFFVAPLDAASMPRDQGAPTPAPAPQLQQPQFLGV